MSNEIIKILDDLAKRFGVAIDWTAENVMPYLKDLLSRLVTFEIVQSAVLIVVACLMLVGCVVFVKILCNDRKKCRETEKSTIFHDFLTYKKQVDLNYDAAPASIAIFCCVAIVAIIILGVNIDDLLRWSIIPEFKIVEWLSGKLGG